MGTDAPTMTVHLHCFAWHDGELTPELLHRVYSWADHIHVWSLGSDGAGAAALSSGPSVTVHPYAATGRSVVDAQRQRFDDAWTLSKGAADWVVLLHADERLHHPDLSDYLQRQRAAGVTAVRAIGHEMVGDGPADGAGAEPITRGCRSPVLDRLVAFSPSALTATHFAPGERDAWPEGHVVWPASPQVLLLRHATVDEEGYVARCRARAADLLADDREQRWVAELEWAEPALRAHVAALCARARTVPGLGGLAAMEPEAYRRDEATIERSGLLDADWYEATYPDIAAQQFDALTHYCEYGWREGRQPNVYFNPAWYAEQCGPSLPAGANPLVHYIDEGERDNLKPSAHFDPRWYRSAYRLDAGESPLRHFLQRRLTGSVAPVPTFSVQAHLAAYPSLRDSGNDPYLHFLATSHESRGPTTLSTDNPTPDEPQGLDQEPLPKWNECLEILGVPDDDNQASATVPLTVVQQVIGQFLPWLPFDEAWYLETNPDVAAAIADGAFESAASHFVEHGFFEGRAPSPGSDA